MGVLAGAAIATAFPYKVKPVQGQSMNPTLNYRDYVLIKRLDLTALSETDRRSLLGTVVCARSPRQAGGVLIKRLKALEGDTAPIPGGVTLAEGQCWLQSDAGKGYYDSTQFGPLAQSAVTGSVCAVVWPPERVGRVV